MLEIEWQNHHFVLMHQRALYWPEQEALLIADPHWGKGASFRSAGLPVPAGSTLDDLRRLDHALQQCGARRLLILGDGFHSATSQAPEVHQALLAWRQTHASLDITLLRGNHDRHAGDPPPRLGIQTGDSGLQLGGLFLAHLPESLGKQPGIAGHLHPGVRLWGPARQRLRLPCFWFTENHAILPAFGSFTGLSLIAPEANQRIYVVGEDAVCPVPLASDG